MRAKEFIIEAATPAQFKSLILNFVTANGITPTNSTRHGIHVRFPLDGNLLSFNDFFKDTGIEVSDTIESNSGSFDTYKLTYTGIDEPSDIDDLESEELESDVDTVGDLEPDPFEVDDAIDKLTNANIEIDTEMPWVNNVVGLGTTSDKVFNTKVLTPDSLSLAGSELSADDIISKTTESLNESFDKDIADDLIKLMELAKTHSNTIKLPDTLTYNSKDLATISKDFGEILAAIWSINNLQFRSAYFPVLSNEKLIDFYGIRMGIKYPISVKSGGGGKVTIQNIIDAIQDRAKTANTDHSEEKALKIFNIVNDNQMKPAMLLLHQEMDTKAIKILGNLMHMDYKDITGKSLNKWLSGHSTHQLRSILGPLHRALGTTLTEAIWKRNDKMRFVISPLGESIWKILNNDKDIKQSLTRVARQVTLIQININVKSSIIRFEANKFKNADFQFGWAGYSAGNKLGFKMRLNK